MNITTIEKPDGIINFAASPCCCPPFANKPEGSIHTRGFTWWMRIIPMGAKGEENPPWQNCGDLVNFRELKESAENCKTLADFIADNCE